MKIEGTVCGLSDALALVRTSVIGFAPPHQPRGDGRCAVNSDESAVVNSPGYTEEIYRPWPNIFGESFALFGRLLISW